MALMLYDPHFEMLCHNLVVSTISFSLIIHRFTLVMHLRYYLELVLTLHEFSQEGDGLRKQHHVVLLQLGRQLHQHEQRGEAHLRTEEESTSPF